MISNRFAVVRTVDLLHRRSYQWRNWPKGGLLQDLMYVESITWQLPTRTSGVAVKPASIFSNLPRHSGLSELSWKAKLVS